jgi:ABC-type transporter Mla MlaB component
MPIPEYPAEAPSRADHAALLQRVAQPFLLFSAVLTLLLIASDWYLLPRLTRVEVTGSVLDASGLQERKNELAERIAGLEEKRERFALAIHDAAYDALKERKLSLESFLDLQSLVRETAAGVTDQADAVHISGFDYRPEQKNVRITGDVRHVDSRSMTVLAEFVDALRAQGFVASVETPPFTRADGPDGPHSPFAFSLTLR